MLSDPVPSLIHPRADPEEWNAWREALNAYRIRVRASISRLDDAYSNPAYTWTSSCYACGVVMLWDESFYDSRRRCYRPETYIQESVERFGGFDAIVLWHAYPRIGFDPRNQFDFYRDMPGGLPALRQVCQSLHALGVRVFIDYNPWDTGTRREETSDAEALAQLAWDIDADGVFLDTMKNAGPELRTAFDRRKAGIAFESELELPADQMADHHMSWAQWFKDSDAPGVLRNKWIERRHMLHQTSRWATDHTPELHTAWMNGTGMLVWENIFGSYNPWSDRDRSILRSMLPIQRRYTAHFTAGVWTPLVRQHNSAVYASSWLHDGITLWTLVNRSKESVVVNLKDLVQNHTQHFFDLIRGEELHTDSLIQLNPRWIGCVTAIHDEAITSDFRQFLDAQARHFSRSSLDASVQRPPVRAVPRPVKRTTNPVDTIGVPGGSITLTSRFRFRECGTYSHAQDIDPNVSKLHDPLEHTRTVSLCDYAIDDQEVTNAQFAEFLKSTDYHPADDAHFLAHWIDGQIPSGMENDAVIYVDLDDARAYAKWAGKRLPTEEEWQHAMQVSQLHRAARHVWNWTESEHTDGFNRFCIIKGGSWFEAQGSQWYADGGERPPEYAAKFILISPSLDRCETIGFRCAADNSTNKPTGISE